MLTDPYLSIVVTGRNDNYGGRFLPRLQTFIDSVITLSVRHHLSAELVIVEWNPPEGVHRLVQDIRWPSALSESHFSVRFIEVPNVVHRGLVNSERMPMFEYVAKNVGIRRSRGQFVLSTNPDLMFNENLISFFADGTLSRHRFYRIDRYDLFEDVPPELPIEQQLQFCSEHIGVVHTQWGSFDLSHDNAFKAAYRLFQSTQRSVRHTLEYWTVRDLLHKNAAGDFFLMAREHWHRLRGYPELPTHSFIDGYICYMAACSGLLQVVLGNGKRIYHQDHDRSEHGKRPLTDYQKFQQDALKMLSTKQPLVYNDEDWGIGARELSERQVLPMSNAANEAVRGTFE